MTAFNIKLIKRIIIVLITLSILSFLILNENGLLKFLNVRSELNTLNQDIKKTEMKLKELENEIDSLQHSKEKKERVAREKFNMMKKNEKVFKIEEN